MKLNNFTKITSNILGSRITGFIRDILFANFLGANLLSDAFLFAYRLPNLFRRIIAEGAVNSVFIPMYINQEKEDQKIANDFIWIIFVIFLLITSFLSLAVFIFNDQIIFFLAPGFLENEDQFLLASELLPITFPFLIFVTLSAILSSVLNVKGKFFLPSFLSVILNFSMIITLLIFKSNSHLALAWAMIISGFIQLFLLFINLSFIKIFFKITRSGINSLSNKLLIFIKRFLLSIMGSGIVQLNIFISMIFASLVGEGSISHIYYADRIIDLPFALVAVAMSITLLPYLSKNISDEEKNSNAFNQTIIFCFIFSLPCVLGLYVLNEDIVRVLFGRGEFLNEDIIITSKVLAIYSISLPGYMLARICNQVFFSYERIDLTVIASIPTFISNLILCMLLYKSFGVVGLAVSGAISVWLNFFIQLYFFKNHFLSFYKRIIIFNHSKIFKIIFSSLAMVIMIYFLDIFINSNLIFELFAQIIVGVIVYFITLRILGLEEYKLIYKFKKFN